MSLSSARPRISSLSRWVTRHAFAPCGEDGDQWGEKLAGRLRVAEIDEVARRQEVRDRQPAEHVDEGDRLLAREIRLGERDEERRGVVDDPRHTGGGQLGQRLARLGGEHHGEVMVGAQLAGRRDDGANEQLLERVRLPRPRPAGRRRTPPARAPAGRRGARPCRRDTAGRSSPATGRPRRRRRRSTAWRTRSARNTPWWRRALDLRAKRPSLETIRLICLTVNRLSFASGGRPIVSHRADANPESAQASAE